jgi:hypothetical protein
MVSRHLQPSCSSAHPVPEWAAFCPSCGEAVSQVIKEAAVDHQHHEEAVFGEQYPRVASILSKNVVWWRVFATRAGDGRVAELCQEDPPVLEALAIGNDLFLEGAIVAEPGVRRLRHDQLGNVEIDLMRGYFIGRMALGTDKSSPPHSFSYEEAQQIGLEIIEIAVRLANYFDEIVSWSANPSALQVTIDQVGRDKCDDPVHRLGVFMRRYGFIMAVGEEILARGP